MYDQQTPDLMSGFMNFGPMATKAAGNLQGSGLNYFNPASLPDPNQPQQRRIGDRPPPMSPFQSMYGMPVTNQVYDQLSLGQGRMNQLQQLGKSGLLQQLFSPFNSMGFQASGPDGKTFASAGFGK